jgi:TPR repeat protein
MYIYGRGVAKDEPQAVQWFRKAAEQGNAAGQAWLGFMYEHGRGISKDEAQAVQWYRKAAEQGFARGEANLGTMYRDGRGVAKDDAEAVQWFRKAAEQGDAFGQASLGFMYGSGRGIPRDDQQAVDWTRKSAEQGNVFGETNLGYLYANGLGVSKDEAEALKWYRKAAEQGLAAAPASIDAMERMARVVTELDPRVKTLEVHGYIAPFGDTGRTARFLFRYQSPDEYALFASRAEDQTAYMAMAQREAVIYDAERGRIVLVDGVVPTISAAPDNNNNLVAAWGVARSKNDSLEPAARVTLDFPSLLRLSKTGVREVEGLGGARYRLIYTNNTHPLRVVFTVDLSSPITFTGLEIHSKGRPVLKLDTKVNESNGAITPTLPEVSSLRARFEVDQTPVPEDAKGLAGMTELMFLPLVLGASGEEGNKVHEQFDKWLGEKHDWQAMDTRYKRDLPKLHELLPMPGLAIAP